MTHMVIYRSPDGSPGQHQTASLEEAVSLVERLRNEQSVTDARIFLMQEIPIEFKTYFRVELAGGTPVAPVAPVAADPVADHASHSAAAAVPAPAPAADSSEPSGDAPPVDGHGDPVGAANGSGRFGLFSRG